MDPETFRITRGLTLAGAAIIGMVVVLLLAIQLAQVLTVIFLGIVLGVALTPIADRLSAYHVPRVASVLLVYGLVAVLLAGFTWYAVIELRREFSGLVDELDELRARYDEWAGDNVLGEGAGTEELLRNAAGGLFGDVVNRAVGVAQALFSVFTIVFVGLLWTISKDRLRDVLSQVLDDRQRAEANRLLDRIGERLRRFVLAEVISMLTVGTITYVGLRLLGVEYALILATIAFVFELVPTIGPWIAYIPAAAVGFTTEGLTGLIKVSLLYLAIQMLENYLVVPVVHGQEIPALFIIIAILIGGVLLGIVGVLAALPVGIILHTLFFEAFVPWRQRQIARRQRRLRPAG